MVTILSSTTTNDAPLEDKIGKLEKLGENLKTETPPTNDGIKKLKDKINNYIDNELDQFIENSQEKKKKTKLSSQKTIKMKNMKNYETYNRSER